MVHFLPFIRKMVSYWLIIIVTSCVVGFLVGLAVYYLQKQRKENAVLVANYAQSLLDQRERENTGWSDAEIHHAVKTYALQLEAALSHGTNQLNGSLQGLNYSLIASNNQAMMLNNDLQMANLNAQAQTITMLTNIK
jgi:hypothetical protein